ELGVERALGPPARRDPGGLADHVAAAPDPVRLLVLVVDAGVADVRRGHRDDLPAVGRVGQRLLVAGPAGVEHHLAERLAVPAEPGAAQRRAVLEDEHRVRSLVAHRVTFPSRTVALPRRNVAATAPGSGRPANGLLRLLDACVLGSTGRAGAAASYRVRLAAAPGAIGCPWPGTRPMLAGRTDIRSATSAQSSSPVSTMASCTTRSAVSRPVMPLAAAAHSASLASTGCGAWSVATQSMVPSASPWRSASTSAWVRSGGLTLNT